MLREKQQRFVDAYMLDPNATKAAIAAGYSPKSAESKASKLMARDDIKEAIKEARKGRSQRVEVNADDVLRTLLRLLNSDIGEAFREDGSLKPIHEMPEDVRKAIQSVEVDELWEGHGEDRARVGETKKVKFWSKDKALELSMRHLGMLNDKLKVNVSMTLEQLVEASMEPDEGGGS